MAVPVDVRGNDRAFPPKEFEILALVGEAGANDTAEEWVRFVRFALEFWVVLAGQEKRVTTQLD